MGLTSCRRWLVQATAILSNYGSFGVILWLLHDHMSNIFDLMIIIITLMLMFLMIYIYLKFEVIRFRFKLYGGEKTK
jgi:hypothetical protein